MRPQMAARPLHLFEAGVVTETRFAGMAAAPGALSEHFVPRLGPEKHVRVPFNPRDRWGTDPRERANLDRSKLTRIRFDAEQADLSGIIAFARKRKIWLHVDIDVVDPAEVGAVVFPAAGGVSLAGLGEAITSLASVSDVRGFEICGYDPTLDVKRKLPPLLADLFTALSAKVLA